MALKPTYAELAIEVAQLKIINDNLWRCVRSSSVALRNIAIESSTPYTGRLSQK